MDFASFIFSNAFVIMFLPIWSALLITLNSTVPAFRSKHFTINLTMISTGICAIYSFCLLFITASTKMLFNNDLINWLQLGNSYIGFGVLLDNMSALFLCVFLTISFLIQLYSYKHIKEEEGFQRYFVYLNIFNFAMTGLLISTNLFQTFMFFVPVGIFAYLLYGFLVTKKSADTASKNILLLNILGDCLILTGIILITYCKLNFFPDNTGLLLNYSSLYDLCQGIISYATDLGFFMICLFIILGLVLKSLMFTFFTNSQNTIEAPFSSFAIIEATAFLIPTVYVMIRLLPIFNLSPLAIKTIFIIGFSISLICALLSIFQQYLRKIISYSLCAQIGLIFTGLSIFSTASGIFYTITSAFSCAFLILTAGLITEIYGNSDDIRYMGGLRKSHPILFLMWLTGSLSFTGLFFSGIFSQIQLSEGFLSKGMLFEYGLFLFIVMLITFTFAKTVFYIFEGEYKGLFDLIKIKNFIQTKISLCLLLIFTAFLGLLTYKLYGNLFDLNLKTEISVKGILVYYIINLLSISAAFIFYKKKIKIEGKLPKIKISITPIYKILCNVVYFIEQIINECLTNVIRFTVKALSFSVLKMKTANSQVQVMLSVFGIILALIFALFYYYLLRGI